MTHNAYQAAAQALLDKARAELCATIDRLQDLPSPTLPQRVVEGVQDAATALTGACWDLSEHLAAYDGRHRTPEAHRSLQATCVHSDGTEHLARRDADGLYSMCDRGQSEVLAAREERHMALQEAGYIQPHTPRHGARR